MAKSKKKKKAFGVKDIAELSGVSIATVSRVLNNPELAAPETRAKVLKVVKENNYISLQASKKPGSHAAGITKSIVIFILDMNNPYYVDLIDRLNYLAFENNYALIICNAKNDYEREAKYYEYCKSIHTSAIIYTAGTARENLGLNEDDDFDAPIILLDREGFNKRNSYGIIPDNRKGSELLVDYLYKLNHRKIGYISGPPNMMPARERLNGFLQAMQKLGLEVPDHYIKQGHFTVKGGTDCFDYFYSMSDAPTAIMAANDLSARGFIMRANSLGVKIPDEFSVCGFDGVDSDSFYPVITSIKQDTKIIAETIFNIILNAGKAGTPRRTLLDVDMSKGVTCHKI
ncbi:MAG: LacI family DNA-binding transcriptional regulator [Christensenellaceae bacterium]|jgi:DNA-binding LacI/PurR family transcriptional regulator